MRTHVHVKTPSVFGSTSTIAVLALAMAQCGCALLDTPGVSLTPPASAAQPEAGPPLNKPAQACMAAGRKFELKGRIEEAIAQYEQARQHDANAPVTRRLARLYDRVGNTVKARAEFDVALQANPKDGEALTDLGCFHYQHGEWKEAEQRLREALVLDRANERAWVALGLVLGKQERYEESTDALAAILTSEEMCAKAGDGSAKTAPASNAKRDPRSVPTKPVIGAPPLADVTPTSEKAGP